MSGKKEVKLSEKAKSILTTLCSNYRERMQIKAEFRCFVYYGTEKFKKEVTKALNEIKKAGYISDFRLADEETDSDTDMFYFNVHANMNMTVEQMAEISINSQTVFKQS